MSWGCESKIKSKSMSKKPLRWADDPGFRRSRVAQKPLGLIQKLSSQLWPGAMDCSSL